MTYEVVIPCHNDAATVTETVESLLAQTVPPLSVTVVDDGSTDGFDSVVPRLCQPLVTVLRRPHSGLGATQNFALDSVQAPLVAFVDADDLWGPRAGEQLVGLFRRSAPSVATVGAGAVRFWDGTPPPWRHLDEAGGSTERLDAAALWRRNPFVKSATMLRAESVRSVGGWRELPGSEDYDLLFRLYGAGYDLLRTRQRHCLLRLRPTSMTTRSGGMLRGHLSAVRTFAETERAREELGAINYPRRAAAAWCRAVSTAAFYDRPLSDVPRLSSIDPALSDVPLLDALVRRRSTAGLLSAGLNGIRPVLTRLGVGRAAA